MNIIINHFLKIPSYFMLNLQVKQKFLFLFKTDSSHTECHLSATKECNSTLFATSQLRYNVYSKNTMFIPTKVQTHVFPFFVNSATQCMTVSRLANTQQKIYLCTSQEICDGRGISKRKV